MLFRSFELIVPIATFLTGTLSGIMLAGGDKDAQKMALQAATRPTTVSPAPTTPSTPSFNAGGLGGSSFGSTATFGGGMMQPIQPITPPFTPSVTLSSTGKPMPTQPPQPEL